jgi:hypothetical protein
VIELLEYLILSIGTFSGSGKKVEITVDNGCVSAISFEYSNPEQQDIKKLSRKKSKVWLEELESIGINRWKPVLCLFFASWYYSVFLYIL